MPSKRSLAVIAAKQGAYYDASLSTFEENLKEIVDRAKRVALHRILKSLTITDGRIDQTASNMRAIRRADKIFVEAMKDAGYDRLVSAFVSHFPLQLPRVEEIIEYLSSDLKTPLKAALTADEDQRILRAVQSNTAEALEAAVETAGNAALTQAVFSIGALKFTDLIAEIGRRFDMSVGRATTLADTAQATFFRTALDRAYRAIDAELPTAPTQYYRYSGPLDRKNRPFCRKLLLADKGYTRAQIDDMSNGQIPNVWLSCGGWNCRHQWIIDTRPIMARMKAAA